MPVRRSSHGYAASVYASGDVAIPGGESLPEQALSLLVDATGRDLTEDVIGWDLARRGYVMLALDRLGPGPSVCRQAGVLTETRPGAPAYVWSAQVRIAVCSTPRRLEGFGRHGEGPGQSTDAGQKRRSQSEAGPVQHGNAPPRARTPHSW